MGGGGKSSTSTQSVSIPPEVLARYNAVNARAEDTANTPFQQYGGEFVAPLNPVQTSGIDATSAASQLAQPYYGVGAGLTLAGAQNVGPLSQGQIGYYQNPYTQAVVNPTVQALQQQQGQQLAQQQSEAIKGGAFGGERAGLQRAQLQGQQNLALGQAIAPLYQQGYGQAVQTAQTQQGVVASDLARQMQAGQQIAGLGTGAQQAALQGAQAQIGAGTLGQQTQQAQDTAQYQQFLQERGYPFQVAQFLANIAEGTGALSGSTTTTTQPRGFFSNRGGFKTGESLRRTGKAYGGGLDPNSMGGAVYEPGAFERGGYATDGRVDPTDLSAILAQQQKSFGPFAQQGLYGGASSGMPIGSGGAGAVPQQQMHVPKLVTAGSLPKAPSGAGSDLGKAYNLANEATTGLTGKGLTERAGEKIGLRDTPDKAAEAAGGNMIGTSANATTGSQNPAGGVAPMPTPRDPTATSGSEGLWDRFTGLFKSEGGGIMPRHHYAGGGGEDSQADEAIPYDPSDVEGTKDPMEGVLKAGSQKPQMLKPSGGGGGGGGGLGGDIMKGAGLIGAAKTIGSAASGLGSFLAPMLLADGGVVPRQHFQFAGAAKSEEDSIPADYSEEADLPSPKAREAGLVVPRQQDDQRAANIKVNPVELEDLPPHQQQFLNELSRPESGGRWNIRYGGLGSKGKEFDVSGAHPNVLEPTDDGQRSSAAGRYQFTGTTWRDIAGDAPMLPGYQNAAALKLARQEYEQKTGRNFDEDLQAKGFTPEMKSALSGRWAGLAKGQGSSSGRDTTSAQDQALGSGKPAGFIDSIGFNKQTILPLLQGIGAMASSKSISPWAAALQGLGAGAKAYGDVEAQQAGIDQTKAQTPGYALQSAQKAIYVDSNGATWINVPGKGWVQKSDWRGMGSPSPTGSKMADYYLEKILPGQAGASVSDRKPEKPATEVSAQATGTGSTPTPGKAPLVVPAVPPIDMTNPNMAQPRGVGSSIADQEARDIERIDYGPDRIRRTTANEAALSDARKAAQGAKELKPSLNSLSLPLSNLAAGEQITPGALASLQTSLVKNVDAALDRVGLSQYKLAPQGLTDVQLADKAQALLTQARTLGLDQRAVSALDKVATSIANRDMTKEAAADILASAYTDNMRLQHESSYALKYAEGKSVPVAQRASEAYRAQYPDIDRQFNLEKMAIKDLLLTKTQNGEALVNYLVGQGKDKDLQKKITPDLIDKKYGVKVSNYFLN